MTERYAIYFAPPATGSLWERAATWLGRDAADGDLFDGPVAGIDRSRLLNLTQSANRYGFHATIKAPMALADGATEADLRAALTSFAAEHARFSIGKLKLASLDGFLALIPENPSEKLQDFAAHVVESFEVFRAPMSVKDRAARLGKGLTERQVELLDGYGYPYVFEQFQFHMTLTDRLSAEDATDIAKAATTWFSPILDDEVVIDSLSLFVEPEKGRPFRRVAEFALGGKD